MGWPQWTIIVLICLGLGIALAQHGEPRSPQNFWTTLVSSGISLWLLWMGGFFSQ